MDKIENLIQKEEKRQRETLMMIPSENYTYPEVRAAVGSVLMQKYAEGQPGKRYYQGNEVVDEVEALCEEYALAAFRLSPDDWGVNVQPHSGCPANLAVYNAILNPGDKIMAMYLPDGGHLSHGWEYKGKKITLVSKIWNVEFYHVNKESEVFDYEQISQQAHKVKPKLLISGGTAYPREIDHAKMGKIAKSAGAYYLADVSHEAGLIAGGVNASPFPHSDFVTMTTHKTLRGPRGALAFARRQFMELLDSSIFPGIQGGPHMHSIAGIAVALEKVSSDSFKNYAQQTVNNAKLFANSLIDKGFHVVSGGTDKHLVLVDLRNKNTNGWFIARALEKAGIIVNQNTVPGESASPFYPSGVRFGLQALTVRGMGENEVKMIAEFVSQIVNHIGERQIPTDTQIRQASLKAYKQEIEQDQFLENIKKEALLLCDKFPIS